MASGRSIGADIRAQLHRQQLQQQRVTGDPRDPTGAPVTSLPMVTPPVPPVTSLAQVTPPVPLVTPPAPPRLENDEPAAGALVSTLAELNALDKVTNF